MTRIIWTLAAIVFLPLFAMTIARAWIVHPAAGLWVASLFALFAAVIYREYRQ